MIFCLLIALTGISLAAAGQIHAWSFSPDYYNNKLVKDYELVFQLENGLSANYYLRLDWPFKINVAKIPSYNLYEVNMENMCDPDVLVADSSKIQSLLDSSFTGSYLIKFPVDLLPDKPYKLQIIAETPTLDASLLNTPLIIAAYTISQTARANAIIVDYNYALAKLFVRDSPRTGITSTLIFLPEFPQKTTMGVTYNVQLDYSSDSDYENKTIIEIIIPNPTAFNFIGTCAAAEKICDSGDQTCVAIKKPSSSDCKLGSPSKIRFFLNEAYKKGSVIRMNLTVKNFYSPNATAAFTILTSFQNNPNVVLQQGLTSNTLSIRAPQILPTRLLLLWGIDTSATNFPTSTLGIYLWKTTNKVIPYNNIKIEFSIDDDIKDVSMRIVWRIGKVTNIVGGSIQQNLDAAPGVKVECYGYDFNKNGFLNGSVVCESVNGFQKDKIYTISAKALYTSTNYASAASFNDTEFTISFFTLINGVATDLAIFNKVKAKPSAWVTSDFIDSTGFHSRKNFGQNLVASADNSAADFAQVSTAIFGPGAKVGVFPTSKKQRLIFYLNSNNLACSATACATATSGLSLNLFFGPGIKVEPEDLPLGIEYSGACVNSASFEFCKNYGQGTSALTNAISYTAENPSAQGAAYYNSIFQCKGDMVSCKKILPGANITFGLKNISFPSDSYHSTSQKVLDIVVSFRSGYAADALSAYLPESLSLINVYTLSTVVPPNMKASFINYYSISTTRSTTSQYMPTLFKISGAFSKDSLPAEGKFSSLSIFFDKFIQADVFMNSPLSKNIGCSVSVNSSAKCYFYNSRDNSALNFDNWPLQQSVNIDSIFEADASFTIYFPVYNILPGIPASIVLTGGSNASDVVRAFRIFGSAFNIEDFNKSRSLLSDFMTSPTPAPPSSSQFAGTADWTQYSTDANFNIKNPTYGIDPSFNSSLIRGTTVSSLDIRAGHSIDNYFDIVNNGTNRSFIGAGFTLISQSAKSILQAYTSFIWEAGDGAACANFEFLIQGAPRPFSLLHCPSNKQVFCTENAKLTLKNVKTPLKFGAGTLTGEINYAWSNNEGSLISFKRESITLQNTLKCSVESITQVLNVQSTSQRLNLSFGLSADIEVFPGSTTLTVSIGIETNNNTNFTSPNTFCSIYSEKAIYLTCQSVVVAINVYTFVIAIPSTYALVPKGNYTLEFWVGYSGYEPPLLKDNTPLYANISYAGYLIEMCSNPKSKLSFSEYSLGTTIYLENFALSSPMKNTLSSFSFDFYTMDQAIIKGDYFMFDFSFIANGIDPTTPPSCLVYKEDGNASFDFLQVNSTSWSFFTLTAIDSIKASETKRYSLKCFPFQAVYDKSMIKAMLIDLSGIIKLEADPIQLDAATSLGTVKFFDAAEFVLKEKLINIVGYDASYSFSLRVKVKIFRGSEIRIGFSPQDISPAINIETRLICEVENVLVDCRIVGTATVSMTFPDEYESDREINIKVHRVPQISSIRSTDVIWASLFLLNTITNKLENVRYGWVNETAPNPVPTTFLEIFNVSFSKLTLRDLTDIQFDFSTPVLQEGCSLLIDFPLPFLELLISKKSQDIKCSLFFTNDSSLAIPTVCRVSMNRITMELINFKPIQAENKYRLSLKLFSLPTPIDFHCEDFLFELYLRRNCIDASNSLYYPSGPWFYSSARKVQFVDNPKIELEWDLSEFQGSLSSLFPLEKAPRELYTIYCVLRASQTSSSKFQIDLLDQSDYQKVRIVPADIMKRSDTKFAFLLSVRESVKVDVFFLNFKLIDSNNVYALIPPLKLTLDKIKCQVKLSTNQTSLHQGGISFPIFLDFSACLTTSAISVTAEVNQTYPNGISIRGKSTRTVSTIVEIPTDQSLFLVDFSFQSNITESTIGLDSYINFNVNAEQAKYVDKIPDLLVTVDLPILDDPLAKTINYKPDQANFKHGFEVACGQSSQVYYAAGLREVMDEISYATIEANLSNPIENIVRTVVTERSVVHYGFQNDILNKDFVSKFELTALKSNFHYRLKAFCVNMNRMPSQEISKDFDSFDNGGRISVVTFNFSEIISNATENKMLCIMNAIFSPRRVNQIMNDNRSYCIPDKSSRILDPVPNITVPEKKFIKFYVFPNDDLQVDNMTSAVAKILSEEESFKQNLNSRAKLLNFVPPQIQKITLRTLALEEMLSPPKLLAENLIFNISEKDMRFNLSMNYPGFIYFNISNTTNVNPEDNPNLNVYNELNFTRVFIENKTATILIGNLTNATNYTLFVVPTPDDPSFNFSLSNYYRANFTTLNQSNNTGNGNFSQRVCSFFFKLALLLLLGLISLG